MGGKYPRTVVLPTGLIAVKPKREGDKWLLVKPGDGFVELYNEAHAVATNSELNAPTKPVKPGAERRGG
jgi:hypothetical protein